MVILLSSAIIFLGLVVIAIWYDKIVPPIAKILGRARTSPVELNTERRIARNSEQMKFSQGKIRRNRNFYILVFAAAMFALLGLVTIIEGRLEYRRVLVFEGNPAIFIGIIFLCFGLFFLYHLLFKAEAEEYKLVDYHPLEDFEGVIDGYNTKFEIKDSVVIDQKGVSIPTFYYILEVDFKKEVNINVYIKERDKIEYLLYRLGLGKLLSKQTGNDFFDSRYIARCTSRDIFHSIFDKEVIDLLVKFDRDHPPIRKRNGILKITDRSFRYIEGPYREEGRVFDPHRGKVEDLFKELTMIMDRIENNAMGVIPKKF